jgi:hypothetical protein
MSSTITATPLIIAQRADRARADAQARLMAARRRDTIKNGYTGPLTRAEASAAALRAMTGRAS